MIIGLTGSYCSGKDTVADYIVQKHGFGHYSLSEIIREIMKDENIESTRENLIVFGTNLRAQNGNGILAKKVLEKMEDKNYCITSIRHPDEVNELRKRKDFILINVDAPKNIRFERMRKRKRTGDPETFEKFIEFEKRESQNEGTGQQLTKCAKIADMIFINDLNDINALNIKIEQLLFDISLRLKQNV
ncbi:MAG: dephospho-CoA kinase [Endomicrobium sp.]|jgi:dephospho-CoA kinase|nr:dephospho-CoA kinase [Endomicrobium sp.]